MVCHLLPFAKVGQYCCTAWGCTTKTNLGRLQKCQNKFARLVLNAENNPINALICNQSKKECPISIKWLTNRWMTYPPSILKGEVQSRITINSKERIKISLQIKNENRIRNKEVVTFWFHIFSENISWPVLMNIQMKWCHHLTIFYTFHLQKWQKSHISAMRM